MVDLWPLEYRLLAFFLAASGRALTRAADSGRGLGTGHTTRSCCGQSGDESAQEDRARPRHPRYLVSIRGVGYRFDAKPVTEQ